MGGAALTEPFVAYLIPPKSKIFDDKSPIPKAKSRGRTAPSLFIFRLFLKKKTESCFCTFVKLNESSTSEPIK